MEMVRAIVVLVALVGAGCTVGGTSGDPAPTSTTARITSDPNGTTDKNRLLTEEDIRAVEGVPPGLQESETDDVPVYENPDPRGPCGAKIDMPAAGSGDFAMFTAEGLLITEDLFTMDASTAQELVDAFRNDIKPNCPPFTSETNTSSLQNNEFLAEVDLPADAGNAVATLSYVQTEGGLPFYGGFALFQKEGTLGMIGVVSGSEIPEAMLAELTLAAVEKL